MACMEHVCRICSWATFDNAAHTCCPDHPGETSHFFDEPKGDDEREEPEPEEEEDDDASQQEA